MRIAKYRLFRTAIREITAAFKEGLQNAYQFSKSMGESGLAEAMDSLATKSLTMKNQLGAAFGALLTNIMPIVLKIIEIVTRAANAITQLFAVLGGKSGYNKAVDASQEWAKNTAAGAKSAKEMRNQLMGFDEINRLDAPESPSGGGGGANATDYSKMFEWSEFDTWTEKLSGLKEQIDSLWQTIKTTATQVWNYIKENIDFGKLFSDIITGAKGVVELVGGILSGDWNLAWQGAADVVNGVAGVIDQVLGFIGNIVSSLFNWVSGSVDSFFNFMYEKTGLRLSGLQNLITGVLSTVGRFVKDLFEDIRQIFSGIIDFLGGIFTQDWERMWTGIAEILAGIGQMMVDAFFGVINLIISAINGLTGFANDVISWVGGKFQIGKIGQLNAPQVYSAAFATGGFPEDGLFFANHGELVGQFSNGNTAVANNEQIVEGIRRGVYDAVSSAMSNNRGSQDVRVYLDGKQISNAVTKQQRSLERTTGVSFA